MAHHEGGRTLDRVVEPLTTMDLQALVESHSDELASTPGIIDWGVGLGSDSRPVVQIFTTSHPGESVMLRLGRWFGDQIEVIDFGSPAEAQ